MYYVLENEIIFHTEKFLFGKDEQMFMIKWLIPYWVHHVDEKMIIHLFRNDNEINNNNTFTNNNQFVQIVHMTNTWMQTISVVSEPTQMSQKITIHSFI